MNDVLLTDSTTNEESPCCSASCRAPRPRPALPATDLTFDCQQTSTTIPLADTICPTATYTFSWLTRLHFRMVIHHIHGSRTSSKARCRSQTRKIGLAQRGHSDRLASIQQWIDTDSLRYLLITALPKVLPQESFW
jgi:hypothetical protein